MSEARAWESLRPLLSGHHAVRIESGMTGSGIPDVNYSVGWIELKYLPEWPVRPTTKVRVGHYTKEQRAWATQRAKAGGRVFFLLKVGEREWLLLAGEVAARYVGKLTRTELYGKCVARWLRLPRKEELLKWLL